MLALNKHIESISFIDEVEGAKEESFTFQNEEIYDNLENLRVYETTILHSQSGQKDKIISLFLLKSLRCLEEKTGESKFTIILPLKKYQKALRYLILITLYLVFIFIYLFSDQKIGGVTFYFIVLALPAIRILVIPLC